MPTYRLPQARGSQRLPEAPFLRESSLPDADEFFREVSDQAGNYGTLALQRLKSWEGYAKAPVLERKCIYAVVVRTIPSDLDQYQGMFIGMDVDGDGGISCKDLSKSTLLMAASHTQATDLFRAADLDGSGTISFTEFVAACLHHHLSPLDRWLAKESFNALDVDQDGLLSSSDVFEVFGEIPAGLPLDSQFDLNMWTGCLLNGSSNSVKHVREDQSSSAVTFQIGPPCGLGASLFGQTFWGGCVTEKQGVAADAPGEVVVELRSEPSVEHESPSQRHGLDYRREQLARTKKLDMEAEGPGARDRAFTEPVHQRNQALPYFRYAGSELPQFSSPAYRSPVQVF